MSALPTVFLSHGSPTLALNPGATGKAWSSLGVELQRPKAVLMISAHWETASPEAGAVDLPETIHDFYGFPEPLFQLRYPAPGAPWLAERVRVLLGDAGRPVTLDGKRGIDHGAWVPMMSMYPEADVPVAQLSLQTRLGTRHHFEVGRALAPLADEGVLIVASGNVTHNLREVMWGVEDPERIPAYVTAFQKWLFERLSALNVDGASEKAEEELLNYRELAPSAARAHPTEEHFLPLYVAVGAAGANPVAKRTFAGITEGVLAMDVYTFQPTDQRS